MEENSSVTKPSSQEQKGSRGFKKNFNKEVNRIITDNNLDSDKVIIMTQDEGRFGRVNIPKASWAPMGMRPNVAKQVVMQSFYVYCAVAPRLGKISSLILPFGNTDMMNIFLDNVSQDLVIIK
jgi:hypothetical protein